MEGRVNILIKMREALILRLSHVNVLLNIEPWRQEKHWDLPYDSSEHRPNFRCVVTGRARGNYPEFRVSRK